MNPVAPADPAESEWLRHLQPPYDITAPERRLTEAGLPAGYEAYVRMFHPFVPWGADPGDVIAPESRRTWREMAQLAGVEYQRRTDVVES